jgi:hypothetical protein
MVLISIGQNILMCLIGFLKQAFNHLLIITGISSTFLMNNFMLLKMLMIIDLIQQLTLCLFIGLIKKYFQVYL